MLNPFQPDGPTLFRSDFPEELRLRILAFLGEQWRDQPYDVQERLSPLDFLHLTSTWN